MKILKMFFKSVNVFLLLLIAFNINSTKANSLYENRSQSLYCMDLNPQNSVDIEQILGTWYGNEIITHYDDNNQAGVYYYNTCVRIHIASISDTTHSTDSNRWDYVNYGRTESSTRVQQHHYQHSSSHHQQQQQQQYLRLVWEEIGTNLEYTLRYNSTKRGFWISSGPQRGNMVDLQYRQFSGTIQVMKAVVDHLVLTFCNNLPGSQIFTVVLSRRPEALSNQDLESVRNLLQRRGLSTTSIRKVCSSGAERTNIFNGLLVFFLVLVSSKYL